MIGLGFLLPFAGIVPDRPAGTLIRSAGVVVLGCFLVAASIGLHSDRGGWDRAVVIAVTSAALMAVLVAMTLLHIVLGITTPIVPAAL